MNWERRIGRYRGGSGVVVGEGEQEAIKEDACRVAVCSANSNQKFVASNFR